MSADRHFRVTAAMVAAARDELDPLKRGPYMEQIKKALKAALAIAPQFQDPGPGHYAPEVLCKHVWGPRPVSPRFADGPYEIYCTKCGQVGGAMPFADETAPVTAAHAGASKQQSMPLADEIALLIWNWAGLDDLNQRQECCERIRAILSAAPTPVADSGATDNSALIQELRNREGFVAQGPMYLMQLCRRAADALELTAAKPASVDAVPVAAIDLVIRDVCETDPADPDADDTVSIRVEDLRLILETHLGGEVPPSTDTDEAEALRAFDKSVKDRYMHECGSYTAGYVDCLCAHRDAAPPASTSADVPKTEQCSNCGLAVDPRCGCERGRAANVQADSTNKDQDEFAQYLDTLPADAPLTDAEINEITYDRLGNWPSFEAQSWACKVVHAVLDRYAVPAQPASLASLLQDNSTLADVDQLVSPPAERTNEINTEAVNAGLDISERNLDLATDALPHGESPMQTEGQASLAPENDSFKADTRSLPREPK